LAHPVHLYWPACLPAQAVAAANTTPNLKQTKKKNLKVLVVLAHFCMQTRMKFSQKQSKETPTEYSRPQQNQLTDYSLSRAAWASCSAED
jgi:hypothetical protein